eukprot:3892227-Amphidinium_carterae.1
MGGIINYDYACCHSREVGGAAVPKDCAEVEVQFLRNGSELIVLPNPEQKPMIRHRCFIVASCLFLRRDNGNKITTRALEHPQVPRTKC